MARNFRNKKFDCWYNSKETPRIIYQMGIPEVLVSDNDAQLISHEGENFLLKNGIHCLWISSNGATEDAIIKLLERDEDSVIELNK